MTNAELRRVMAYYLDQFNTTGEAVTDETIHATILTDDGPPDPKALYEGSVRWSLGANGHPDLAGAPWPDEWLEMTIAALADGIIAPTTTVASLAPRTRGAAARAPRSTGVPTWYKRLVTRTPDRWEGH